MIVGKLAAPEDIRTIVEAQRESGKKIVHCHGVFDLLHPGHVLHLEEAKSMGDFLIASVTSDRYVNKGPGRPYLGEKDRAMMLAALEYVDLACVSDFENALEMIDRIRPDIYVKGPDYAIENEDITGNLERERIAVERHGGRLVTTSGRTLSSSGLRNQILMNKSSDFGQWLESFRTDITASKIDLAFEEISKLKVLVIGEAIIDEYINCEALGKSSKDPVLAFKRLETERQLGGSLAIARHAGGLGAQVTLLTRIGSSREDEDLVREGLKGKIQLNLLKSNTEPTVVKTRFVDSLTGSKVFETYQIGEDLASEDDHLELLRAIEAIRDDFDLVLVADYGHGLLRGEHIEAISESRGLKAINTQSNAGNRGFNSISKYPVIDVVCLNGSEVSLELKQRHLELQQLLPELAKRTAAGFTAVTSGASGVAFLDSREESKGPRVAPAFASKVSDRVGAGDALFVAAALSWAAKSPGVLCAVMGNLAGAASIVDLGNRVTLDRISLQKHLLALLK